jgi:CzcA family heavy metal efflux pump
MRWLVAWSLKFRLLVVPIAAALMVLGVSQLREMPVDALPEFTPPYVEIQTEALGFSAPEVEELITVPMEGNLLNGVAGIDVIRSETVAGLSATTLLFEPGTDLLDARQLVQERLTQASALPGVTTPPAMLQPLSSASRVMMIGLSSKELSLIELGLLARWTIRPRLLGVPGVANVAMWGQREHQLQVQVDPERLRKHRVSLEQIISTAGNSQLVSPLSFLEASTPGSGGFIDTPNQRLQVRHILPIAKPEGLAQVPVDGVEGKRLRLGDVTEIVEEHQPLIGDAAVGDAPGLLLVVEKFPGAHTLEVTRDVEKALDALRPGLSGVEVDSSIFRPANFIETAIDNLTMALVIGGALLVLALVALFFEWRIAVISLVSIPLSLVAAALVLSLRGETMNALALAGLVLAVALVVDDGIIGAENTWRRLRQRRGERSDRPAAAIVLEASVEARSPITFATLIVVLAVVPVFFLEGPSGAFFEPLAISYALAVLASMLVALTVTPALSLILLQSAPLERRDAPLVRALKRGYGALLSRILRAPGMALAALGVIALPGLAVVPWLDSSLLPSFKERELLVHVGGPPGTSRAEMTRITNRIGGELRGVEGVRNVGAHVGRAVMSDQVVGIDAGELWVSLDPEADYDETVSSVQEVVDGYPGLDRELVTYSNERIRQVGALSDGNDNGEGLGLDALRGVDEPLVVRLYGKDLEILRSEAEKVRQVLAGVDGVVDPRLEVQVEEPTLEIEADLTAARRHGLKPGDIRRAAATLVQGITVGSLFEEQKVFDVIVTGVAAARHSPTSIGELPIDTPSGDRVRLADVADVRVAPTPTVIRREAASRRVDVIADVDGRDLGAVVSDVERRLENLQLPLEYHAEVLDEATERQAAGRRMLGFAIAAAIGILLLLQAAFGSWRFASLFFLAMPLALAGGLLAVFIAGGTISLGSLLGFFAVFGIATRNGILLVNRYQHLEREGESFGPGLVLQGASERLTPLVMTAVSSGLALLPFVVLGAIPGNEIVHPMAVVILGALVTSTLFNLVVVPSLYLRLAPATSPEPFEQVVGQPAAGR